MSVLVVLLAAQVEEETTLSITYVKMACIKHVIFTENINEYRTIFPKV